MTGLEGRLEQCLTGTPLRGRLAVAAAPFLERRGADPVLAEIGGGPLRGLARLLACSPEMARYLSIRPSLLERLVSANASSLGNRARELSQTQAPGPLEDLEAYLDALRLLRRDETVFGACLQVGGLVDFEEVSSFLSIVAETCMRWALLAASESAKTASLAIVGMGKIAGKEFSYASDLDLIFLYPGQAAEIRQPSRVAQRLIAYLTSMTGAGVAYAVDSRLRPSGRQGALVSTFESFGHYQRQRAQTWEHLALMRARTIAGEVAGGEHLLRDTRTAVLAKACSPWADIAEMRGRVERERGQEAPGCVPFKTGRGGLMEVEFLASGGILERGTAPEGESLPSVPALLRRVSSGVRSEALLAQYAFLRRVEGCARLISGRAVESVETEGDDALVLAEIVEPGTPAAALAGRIEDARTAIRRSYEAVIESGGIAALSS